MLVKLLALASVAALALVTPVVQAAEWAVIVSGSYTFGNYRHQADAAHAYQLVSSRGIPNSNIITMLYDDIANDPENPFPGQVFNKPTDVNTPGVDVWKNVQKDYTGGDVTPEVFLGVITGNTTAATKKVLGSTSADNVFIFFVDHGGAGLIAFPETYLYATDLIPALKKMHDNKMYKKLVFYIEACESGSMFDGLLPNNWNMYATTASNPTESSWATYCPPEDSVNGKEVGSCLGDLYSVNFLENADTAGPSETLQQQFVIVANLTTQSQVMQFGDQSFTSEPIGNYMGNGGKKSHSHAVEPEATKSKSVVSSRDVPVHLAYYKYVRAAQFSAESAAALADLRKQLDAREASEARFLKLSQILAKDHDGAHAAETLFNTPSKPIYSGLCVKSAVEALKARGCDYDDHSLQFHKVIVNACGRHSSQENGAASLIAAIEQVC